MWQRMNLMLRQFDDIHCFHLIASRQSKQQLLSAFWFLIWKFRLSYGLNVAHNSFSVVVVVFQRIQCGTQCIALLNPIFWLCYHFRLLVFTLCMALLVHTPWFMPLVGSDVCARLHQKFITTNQLRLMSRATNHLDKMHFFFFRNLPAIRMNQIDRLMSMVAYIDEYHFSSANRILFLPTHYRTHSNTKAKHNHKRYNNHKH